MGEEEDIHWLGGWAALKAFVLQLIPCNLGLISLNLDRVHENYLLSLSKIIFRT
jgi:hypothetical protein